MTHLSTTYPDDLWGSAARRKARLEAQEERAIMTKRESTAPPCRVCHLLSRNAKRWCVECGGERVA